MKLLTLVQSKLLQRLLCLLTVYCTQEYYGNQETPLPEPRTEMMSHRVKCLMLQCAVTARKD